MQVVQVQLMSERVGIGSGVGHRLHSNGPNSGMFVSFPHVYILARISFAFFFCRVLIKVRPNSRAVRTKIKLFNDSDADSTKRIHQNGADNILYSLPVFNPTKNHVFLVQRPEVALKTEVRCQFSALTDGHPNLLEKLKFAFSRYSYEHAEVTPPTERLLTAHPCSELWL